ncbi:short-chain dehydrogenase, putative [Perkinsus marinus ATCC 50983]|uniref:Short-chain dehydrogenase, putative n=1 Tax=Perkinsus marinus (strain ATCC 50983 / TXsc) TaxID=423536 RepID=C5KFE5_PERM5|nr:short-chain dehydrogenase, putative [Perkinsus marinus ATCC 50983]EER16805.1 short-chain dehydrogenase, putative [Perkinsus marinus ATCC 50983]|eukprot:XP_002785009.1 short-chain dehydrogenase, putative [Perkinsus marinus ATCC 50983]
MKRISIDDIVDDEDEVEAVQRMGTENCVVIAMLLSVKKSKLVSIQEFMGSANSAGGTRRGRTEKTYERCLLFGSELEILPLSANLVSLIESFSVEQQPQFSLRTRGSCEYELLRYRWPSEKYDTFAIPDLQFACGAKVVVAAKTVEPTPTLPGTIYTVAREIEEAGGVALPLQLDLRDAESCEKCVAAVIAKFGRIDILINNASAMWWHSMEQTPIKKFDLITSINSRGSFIMTKLCLPHMKKNNYGRVINMSPPISTHFMSYRGLTAYNISKFGMTMSAMGAAAEGQGHNVTGNCLWPATVVESQAATNFELGSKDDWRKSTILADCVLCIVNDPELTGEMLIDDEYLRSSRVGLTQEDLVIYRKNPAVEPRRHLAEAAQKGKSFGERVSRGDIRQVAVDKMRSMI